MEKSIMRHPRTILRGFLCEGMREYSKPGTFGYGVLTAYIRTFREVRAGGVDAALGLAKIALQAFPKTAPSVGQTLAVWSPILETMICCTVRYHVAALNKSAPWLLGGIVTYLFKAFVPRVPRLINPMARKSPSGILNRAERQLSTPCLNENLTLELDKSRRER